jgi:hypothetical protein
MAKHFKRGTPESEEDKAHQAFIRHLFEQEVDAGNVEADLLGGEMFDLLNGEVELVLPDGRLFRLYTVDVAQGDTRVVIDDYHPEEDAVVTVDEFDIVTDPDHPHVLQMEEEMRGQDLPTE